MTHYDDAKESFRCGHGYVRGLGQCAICETNAENPQGATIAGPHGSEPYQRELVHPMTDRQAVIVATLVALDAIIQRCSLRHADTEDLRNDLGQLATIVRRLVAPQDTT